MYGFALNVPTIGWSLDAHGSFIASLVVIHNFHIEDAISLPTEANAELVVYTNTVLPLPINP